VTAAAVGVAVLLAGAAAHASPEPDQACLRDLYRAAATYAECQQELFSRYFAGWFPLTEFNGRFLPMLSRKCTMKYTGTWENLRVKYAGTGTRCTGDRFGDHWGATVVDKLTGLEWEKKTNDGTVHDKDNAYPWSEDPPAANGQVFKTFLATLNSGFGPTGTSDGCFRGYCDWRLPTVYELQTILWEPYPCTTRPCIDTTVFGPTNGDTYYSATTFADWPDYVWGVVFHFGDLNYGYKGYTGHVRAVRTHDYIR